MIEFSVLSSGSKANCTYVRCDDTHLLIDCGLSAKEAARRLDEIGVSADNINAIIVSHEHTDHVGGVRVFSKRHRTGVFTTKAAYENCRELQRVEPGLCTFFEAGMALKMGPMLVEPFSIVHDAADPVAFRISSKEATLGILTDLGQLTSLVEERVRGLDAIILESNYDPSMLHDAPYPWEIKQRISSRSGHLSNETASRLMGKLAAEVGCKLQVVVAGHISENSNTPELAINSLKSGWQTSGNESIPEFVAGSVSEATEVFKIERRVEHLSDDSLVVNA